MNHIHITHDDTIVAEAIANESMIFLTRSQSSNTRAHYFMSLHCLWSKLEPVSLFGALFSKEPPNTNHRLENTRRHLPLPLVQLVWEMMNHEESNFITKLRSNMTQKLKLVHLA